MTLFDLSNATFIFCLYVHTNTCYERMVGPSLGSEEGWDEG